mmetsp:Transcript_19377/g.56449  ORF Transcript_19377/g.56449 Transcript_19377/m.56449 type:complete len:149 (-) Transcript_19377:417-863(-)
MYNAEVAPYCGAKPPFSLPKWLPESPSRGEPVPDSRWLPFLKDKNVPATSAQPGDDPLLEAHALPPYWFCGGVVDTYHPQWGEAESLPPGISPSASSASRSRNTFGSRSVSTARVLGRASQLDFAAFPLEDKLSADVPMLLALSTVPR